MTRICIVISSIGGPRMLTALLGGHAKDEPAYVVIQRMAAGGLLDVLVECVREETNRKTLVAGQTLALKPGVVHFLPNERHYALDGDRLMAADAPGKGQLSLDHLLASAACSPHPLAVIVLSGMQVDEDGLKGLARLASAGVPIFGSTQAQTPVFDMIEQVQKRGLTVELYPPKYLVEHLRFHTPAGADAAAAPAPAMRFLIADDEAAIRSVVGELLAHEGIECHFASDGLDALRKIQKGRFDALLLDLSMPEMDGLKTLEALKTIDPGLPIVVMTGMEDPAKLKAVREFKVLDILQKPFTWDKMKKLLPKIRPQR